MPEQKKPAPAPGTTDFRETTRLEREDAPAPEQMKKDRAFKETHALDQK